MCSSAGTGNVVSVSDPAGSIVGYESCVATFGPHAISTAQPTSNRLVIDRVEHERYARVIVSTTDSSADVELVISGIGSSSDGQTERVRLETPTRFKMLVTQATADGAGFEINKTPVVKDEFALALEMAKVKQLDRIADLLERIVAQLDERGRKA